MQDRKSKKSSQQEPGTILSAANTSLLSWRLIGEEHSDADAGQGILLLCIFLLDVYHIQYEEIRKGTGTEGDRGGSRVPDCPLKNVSSCTYSILDVCVTSTSHDAFILVVSTYLPVSSY